MMCDVRVKGEGGIRREGGRSGLMCGRGREKRCAGGWIGGRMPVWE